MTDGSTILVTGGAGYIGSHVVLALLDAGLRVVVLDDLSTGCREAVPPGVPLVQASTGDAAAVRTAIRSCGVGAIVHMAGSLIAPESVVDPVRYWRNNLANTLILAEACVAEGVTRLVFSSTAAVYGIPDRLPVDEDAPCRPINPYGASKHAAEQLLQAISAAHRLEVVALRYFNVAGADPAGRAGQRVAGATHLIKVACEAALGQRREVAIYGEDYDTPDGTGIRDYIHVTDLARAHVEALRHLAMGGETAVLNCGYGRGHSVRAVLRAVERATGVTLPVRVAPRRPGDPPAVVAAAQRIRSLLAWRPAFDDLDSIIADAISWERRMAGQSRRQLWS
ncbi:UDP-glucose 4-epimerase GalE [Belnapia sp. T6]|uniref:UDP-glucose 4-epimerase n=1 Tax=Belnapia mucosa TaxID=2804532 RepID=A0ABS1V281_9PROT|nr:UDP-glucose 4-epimerase GalE [Belnapia mucosa]MBL6455801.1 UDP-glucose 4-epimerase GalE [Belnapia mucosa]